MKKIVIFLLSVLALMSGINIFGYEIDKDEKIHVGGQAIGIKLSSGVIVVGSYGILKDGKIHKPWEQAGIIEGDQIISLGEYEVTDTKGLLKALQQIGSETSVIKYKRNNKIHEKIITPIYSIDAYSLGLYVKDSILGVGTLTYYIEEINAYGSLGHQITTQEFYNGQIYEASVNKIIKPTRTEAGEKRASIIGGSIGTVEKNSITGVHGYTNENFDSSKMELLEFKTRDEINLGDAEIWTCINGKKIEKFKIKITNLSKQNTKDIKGISFEVVDERLLDVTGGIIQGMSGSPIIQDNKIIGAVTHVLINDSKKGYGIYLEFMFEDMGITVKK